MDQLELLGKQVKDIISGYEGICTAVIEYLYGCTQYVVRAKTETNEEKNRQPFFLRNLRLLE